MALSPKQEQVLALMLEFKRDAEIAKIVKVRPATICAWKKQKEFRAALDAGVDAIYANEKTFKLEVRQKAWAKLMYLIDLNSTKAVLKALDMTEPAKNSDVAEISVRFGPPMAKKLTERLENMSDPTEELEPKELEDPGEKFDNIVDKSKE